MDLLKFLVTPLLLSLLTYQTYVGTASDDEDFSKQCSSHMCSKHGPEIRFPFRLSTHPPSCGAPGMQLSCSGDDTILDHPALGSCKVTEIYYRHRVINVIPLVEPETQCPLQKLISTNLATDVYKLPPSPTTLVRCSSEFIPADPRSVAGPAACLGNNATQFWYLAAAAYAYIYDLPRDCEAVFRGIPVPYSYDIDGPILEDKFAFNKKASTVINFGETTFTWHLSNLTDVCQKCENEGRHCGFSSRSRQAFCQPRGILSFPWRVNLFQNNNSISYIPVLTVLNIPTGFSPIV